MLKTDRPRLPLSDPQCQIDDHEVIFPDMSSIQKVSYGKRSRLIAIGMGPRGIGILEDE
jgi:hypothetical protein